MEIVQKFTDQELVAAIKSGRGLDDAIRFLYRAHYESLSYIVKANQGSEQDAEDIFQEVMVSFINLVQKDKFRGESSVKTFLYSLIRHTWLNELKRRGRAQLRDIKFEKSRDQNDMDAGHFIAGRESRSQIMQVVEQLGEACKKILIAFYYENLAMKDILETMNYENEQVVRNKKYKCLKQLENMLNENPALAQTLKSALQYEQ